MVPHAYSLVHTTHDILCTQDDLSPRNMLVNTTLNNFVNGLSIYHQAGFGQDMAQSSELALERQQLPVLCGFAEVEMERYWARHFNGKPSLTTQDLEEFWYYRNYTALWDLEDHLIGPTQAKRFVFLGSGPLPMTAIIAALKNPDMQIACLDYDSEACSLSSDLIKKLGLERSITVTQTDATSFAYQPEDFVICASLITGKDKLYKVLHDTPVQEFIVRDAEGAYCFLYAPSQLPEKTQYRELRRTLPNKLCVNMTRYFTRVV